MDIDERKITRFDVQHSTQLDLAVLHRDMPCARSLHKELEIAHICSGELQVIIEDELVTVKTGETLLISGFTIHEFVPPKTEVTVLRAKLDPAWLEAPFWQIEEKERFRAKMARSFVIGQNERVDHLFLAFAKNTASRLAEYRCLAGMMELMAMVLEDKGLTIRSCASGTKPAGGMGDALEFLHRHCNEDLTLSRLAAHLGMSESHCSKSFHQMLGVTFTDFLNTLRISDARYLLASTDLLVIQVAQDVGFSSIQTFNRVFRKTCGQTPTEYRARQKHRQSGGIKA